MTEAAKEEIERRENLAAEFISQYKEKRAMTEDPVLRLGYAVSELLQIVMWLRIEIDRIDGKKVVTESDKYICICGRELSIRLVRE